MDSAGDGLWSSANISGARQREAGEEAGSQNNRHSPSLLGPLFPLLAVLHHGSHCALTPLASRSDTAHLRDRGTGRGICDFQMITVAQGAGLSPRAAWQDMASVAGIAAADLRRSNTCMDGEGTLLDPAEFPHGPAGVPDLGHVTDLAVIELPHADVVAAGALAGRGTGPPSALWVPE